jgi:hypothetical protein
LDFIKDTFSLEDKIFKKEFIINHNIKFLKNGESDENIYFIQKILDYSPQVLIENNPLVL